MDNFEQPGLEPETPAVIEAPAEAQPMTEPAPVAAEAEPAPAAEAQHPFWYRKEIEKERRERERLARENEQLRSRAPAPQRQAPPDPLDNPEGFYGHIEQRLEQQRVVDRLERSEDRFVDKHGEQVLEEVREWLATQPKVEELCIASRNPWQTAHSYYTREKIAAEIGDDPKGYEERLREKILAELQGGQAPAVAEPQMRPRLPGSAATVRTTGQPRDLQTGKFEFKNKF